MRVTVLTLFPEMFAGIFNESILKRAVDSGIVEIQLVNIRDFATDKHRTVDDYPFGGGAGMVLKPGPVFDAVDAVREDIKGASEFVLLSPQGEQFTQDLAQTLSSLEDLVLICGHYEGFDERIRNSIPTREVSLGDFVLTGGEIPAMAIIDAVVRLLPGALGNDDSALQDSFASGLLEHPHYTRPADYRDQKVPAALLSGDHARIAKWRHQQSLYRTWTRRPELLTTAQLTEEDKRWITQWSRGDFTNLIE